MKTTELNENSQNTFSKGSKSFSFASRFFSKDLQEDVAHLYSWCRHCDDVADGSTLGFFQAPAGLPKNRVELIHEQSRLAAFGNADGLDLPFVAFGRVMQKYQVPWIYAEDLLKGMQQDVSGEGICTLEDLRMYSYRVAGTVGLIMCHVMGIKNSRALENAVHLGIALQLTNIIRDIGDDFRVSKIYLPQEWLSELQIDQNDLVHPKYGPKLESLAKRLSKEADTNYRIGLLGLKDLPWRCALAVAVAACVYRTLGRRVIKQGALAWQSAEPEKNRTGLTGSEQTLACILGIYTFLKTVPSRLLSPRSITPIDQIWRYL